jgi:hypothetical protein
MKDANGTLLGYSLNTGRVVIHLVSITGYMYELLWDGTLSNYNVISYTSGDCTGTKYK